MQVHPLYRWFAKRISKKNIGILFLTTLLINVGLAIMSGQILAPSNGVAKIPDLCFVGYTSDEFHLWLDLFGEQGRSTYLLLEVVVDTIYPIAYTLLFTFLGVTGLEYGAPKRMQSLHLLALLPFLVMFLDYIENSCTIWSLLHFPTRYDTVTQIGSIFTTVKWSLLWVIIIFMIWGLISYLIHRKENSQQLNVYE